MKILKERTSGDGYQCRMVKYDNKASPMWEVYFQGGWMCLANLRQHLPGRPSTSALASRIYNKGRLNSMPDNVIRSTPVALWGKRKDGAPYCKTAIPSKWAAEWAKMNGHKIDRAMRDAFIHKYAMELQATPDDSTGALKRTLKNFSCLGSNGAIAS